MKFIRRFWAPAIILVMIAVHAAVIGYVRSRVAELNESQNSTLEIGQLQFQNIHDATGRFQCQLHVVLDPAHRIQGKEHIGKVRIEIIEEAEQMLRQADASWLSDPMQKSVRERLMDIVLQNLDQAFVQRVLITQWLRLPNSNTL